VDPLLRAYVIARDGGCVARFVTMPLEQKRWPMLAGLPDPGPCRDQWGTWVDPTGHRAITADHVKERDSPSMSMKAPDDIDHLWARCYGHHEGIEAGRVWATMVVVREAALAYIAAANAAARLSGWPRVPVWDDPSERWVLVEP
jgi:hypothetical protein